jgi:hypothetical protein
VWSLDSGYVEGGAAATKPVAESTQYSTKRR